MASRSKSDKYFLANDPNVTLTDAQVVDLGQLAADVSTGEVAAGGDAATNGAVTKVLAVSINGTTYYIPLHTANS